VPGICRVSERHFCASRIGFAEHLFRPLVTAPRHECRGFLSVQQEDLFPASTQTAR
jgi:hypothetical protein